MFSRTNNFPFSPNYNFASNNLLATQINQNYKPITPTPSNLFLLLNGSPMLLLNGDDLALL